MKLWRTVFIIAALLPNLAMAMDAASVMLFQEQQERARRIDRENDRIMFGLIQQFTAKEFGPSYANQYGEKQASDMFGYPVKATHSPHNGLYYKGHYYRHNQTIKISNPGLPEITVPKPSAPTSAATKLLVLNESRPADQKIAAISITPVLPVLAPAIGKKEVLHKQPVHRSSADLDDNPDETAWQRAHR